MEDGLIIRLVKVEAEAVPEANNLEEKEAEEKKEKAKDSEVTVIQVEKTEVHVEAEEGEFVLYLNFLIFFVNPQLLF